MNSSSRAKNRDTAIIRIAVKLKIPEVGED